MVLCKSTWRLFEWCGWRALSGASGYAAAYLGIRTSVGDWSFASVYFGGLVERDDMYSWRGEYFWQRLVGHAQGRNFDARGGERLDNGELFSYNTEMGLDGGFGCCGFFTICWGQGGIKERKLFVWWCSSVIFRGDGDLKH